MSPPEFTQTPLGRTMSADAHAELYQLLLDVADESPLEVVANCIEVLATVLNKRLHDTCG